MFFNQNFKKIPKRGMFLIEGSDKPEYMYCFKRAYKPHIIYNTFTLLKTWNKKLANVSENHVFVRILFSKYAHTCSVIK